MLFNSYAFIFCFLPFAVIGYFYIARQSHTLATLFLCAMSFLFYAWWRLDLVWVLLASIVVNYFIGLRLTQLVQSSPRPQSARIWLVCGLSFNIVLLASFKYTDFFITNINWLTGNDWALLHIALPLGISFFTFTQIAFLVDAWRGRVVELSARNYFLFVTYFPHLLAGPIIHHREMMPQFANATLKHPNWDNIARDLRYSHWG